MKVAYTFMNRQHMANAVAHKWKEQYYSIEKKEWKENKFIVSGHHREIYYKLCLTNDPNEIDNIIGNKSWTHALCDVCKNNVEEVIFFEESETYFCIPCLEGAIKLAENERKKDE